MPNHAPTRFSRAARIGAAVAAGVVAVTTALTVVPHALAGAGETFPGFLTTADLGPGWRSHEPYHLPARGWRSMLPPCGESGDAPVWMKDADVAEVPFKRQPYPDHRPEVEWTMFERQLTLAADEVAEVADALARYTECTRAGGDSAPNSHFRYGSNWIFRYGSDYNVRDGWSRQQAAESWFLVDNRLIMLRSTFLDRAHGGVEPIPYGPDGLEFLHGVTQIAVDRCTAECVDHPTKG